MQYLSPTSQASKTGGRGRLTRAAARAAVALAAAAAPVAVVAGSAAPAGAALATVTQQANWILSAQMPNGAIAVWPDRPMLRLVWPYLANAAAIGLARADAATGDAQYGSAAWAYLRWYASVESPRTGYVTNYQIVNGTQMDSTGRYDSTDAYAGTYLAAVWDTYSATGNLAGLRSVSGGVAGALAAIASTQQRDGLTWATPSWHVAYLMDNVQALGGLEAAAAIERVLGDSALAREASARVAAMRGGIQSLWDPSTGAYNWAEQGNGWQHPTHWSNLYPDSLEQVAAVEWGAVPAARSAELMSRFSSAQPSWSKPNAMANYLNGATVVRQKVSYWPSVPIALDAVSMSSAARSGLSSILGAASASGYRWPYTTGDAGEAIVAAAGSSLLAPTGSAGSGSQGSGPGTHTSPPSSPPNQGSGGGTAGQGAASQPPAAQNQPGSHGAGARAAKAVRGPQPRAARPHRARGPSGASRQARSAMAGVTAQRDARGAFAKSPAAAVLAAAAPGPVPAMSASSSDLPLLGGSLAAAAALGTFFVIRRTRRSAAARPLVLLPVSTAQPLRHRLPQPRR